MHNKSFVWFMIFVGLVVCIPMLVFGGHLLGEALACHELGTCNNKEVHVPGSAFLIGSFGSLFFVIYLALTRKKPSK